MASREDLENFIHESTYRSALKHIEQHPGDRVFVTEKREITSCWACKNGFSSISYVDKLDLKYDLTRIQYCPICGRKV